MKSLLLLALGLARTVVLGAHEAERIVVSVRPYKARAGAPLPVCGRACDFYDMASRGAPGCGGAMDLARSACLGTRPAGCAARSTACAPRPSPGRGTGRASRATSRTGWRGWRSAAPPRRSRARPRRVAQRGRRVQARLRRAGGRARRLRFDGVRRIGIDETSYKKGPQVRHGGRRPRPAAASSGRTRGHRQGRAQPVLDELTREQRRAIGWW